METNFLTNGPVSPTLILQFTEKLNSRTDTGGHSLFLGQVRADEINGKKVKAIEYSAYVEMINTEAEKIIKSIMSEFQDVRNVEIIHSTGIVRSGEISLLVIVSAGHRLQAMQACTRTVDLIKQNLPVWKKEIFEDDSSGWK